MKERQKSKEWIFQIFFDLFRIVNIFFSLSYWSIIVIKAFNNSTHNNYLRRSNQTFLSFLAPEAKSSINWIQKLAHTRSQSIGDEELCEDLKEELWNCWELIAASPMEQKNRARRSIPPPGEQVESRHSERAHTFGLEGEFNTIKSRNDQLLLSDRGLFSLYATEEELNQSV